ncbi:FAD-dependent oxidoreductase [Candidatus Woesearchaeota archaeon]|nr:FAD-dependent oxidoreductase [Candidatus Woesearchaeota archaeon]
MYDIIIIGAGFAGFSAAIYSARYNLKTLVIAREPGGAINIASEVENYPGFKKISGLELMKHFEEQAKSFGAELVVDEVEGVIKQEKSFKVETRQKKEFEAKTVILAMGTQRRKLEVLGAKEFEGKGVHYCATCDGAFYRDKVVAVIGGSNSAAHSALLLARFAKKVYIIYRREKLRSEPILIKQIKETKNIEIIYKNNVIEVKGDKFVNKAVLDNEYKKSKELALDGIFVEIGSVPSSAIAKELGVKLTQSREIIVNEHCETNIKGVCAAGDVTNTVLKQGIVAASQGAIAASSAYGYITGKKAGQPW